MTVITDMNYMPESQPFEGFEFLSEHDDICPQVSVDVALLVLRMVWGIRKDLDFGEWVTRYNLITLSPNANARARLI